MFLSSIPTLTFTFLFQIINFLDHVYTIQNILKLWDELFFPATVHGFHP